MKTQTKVYIEGKRTPLLSPLDADQVQRDAISDAYIEVYDEDGNDVRVPSGRIVSLVAVPEPEGPQGDEESADGMPAQMPARDYLKGSAQDRTLTWDPDLVGGLAPAEIDVLARYAEAINNGNRFWDDELMDRTPMALVAAEER